MAAKLPEFSGPGGEAPQAFSATMAVVSTPKNTKHVSKRLMLLPLSLWAGQKNARLLPVDRRHKEKAATTLALSPAATRLSWPCGVRPVALRHCLSDSFALGADKG